MLVRWLKSLWSRERPTTPILLRVTDADGTAPFVLDVQARWLPTGKCIDRSVRTADGLCVIHWFADQDEAELTVRSTLGSAVVNVERGNSRGRTIAVQLVAGKVFADGDSIAPSVSTC